MPDWGALFSPRRRTAVVRCAALYGMVAVSGPVVAANVNVPFDGLVPVSDSQLGATRGGIRLNGFDISLGIRIETSLSGLGRIVTALAWKEQQGWSRTSARVTDAAGYSRSWDPTLGVWKDDQLSSASGVNPGASVATQPSATVTPVAQPTTWSGVPSGAPNNMVTPAIPVSNAGPPDAAAVSAPTLTLGGVAQTVSGSPTVQAGAAVTDKFASVATKVADTVGGAMQAGGYGNPLGSAVAGSSEILHDVGAGQLATLVKNTQSGVEIAQRTELNVTIENFAAATARITDGIRARAIATSGIGRF